MADEYLSLYESVDYQLQQRSELAEIKTSSEVRAQNKYEALTTAVQEKNNYQQLSVQNSDIKLEIKQVKRELRYTKLFAIAGFITFIIIICVIFVALTVAFTVNRRSLFSNIVNASSNSDRVSNNKTDHHILSSYIFQNCSNEIRSCYIRQESNNRFFCNTEYVPIKREV